VLNIKEDRDSITITVRVIPRSSVSEIVGEYDGAVKVRLTSPPVDGAANADLIKLLAKKLDVPKSSITIVSGETSKTKRLRVSGVTSEKLRSVVHR
jgi:uncharacterized protein